MSSIMKATKKMDVDRLSSLNEPILITILSLLPFKEAARTCVLSKKWPHIWRATRNIDFDELLFVDPDESREIIEEQRRIFLNFITHFMENYKGDRVDKFSLKISNPQSCVDIIERCVAFATERGVKELRLDFSDPTWEEYGGGKHDALFQLPNHVYRHASLEALELYACGFSMPDLCNLIALKDISFGWIELSLNTIKTLLSTLEKLENLSMKRCWNIAHFDLRIQEIGLRRLIIDNCDFATSDYVDLRAPKLKFLKYYGKLGIFEVKGLPDVVEEAQLDFTLMSNFEYYGDELCELLRDLKCARVLTVCSFLLQAIHTGEEENRMQHDMNVRHLIVKTDLHNREIYGFVLLLSSCIYLEKLTLNLGEGKIYYDCVKPYSFNFWKFCTEQSVIFECLKNTLKVVKMKGFRGRTNEMYLCYNLIKVGCVLEQLIIYVDKKNEDGEMLEENDDMLAERYGKADLLYEYEKASENLEILIV